MDTFNRLFSVKLEINPQKEIIFRIVKKVLFYSSYYNLYFCLFKFDLDCHSIECILL